MYRVDGWIELLDADVELCADDWRYVAERRKHKEVYWKERALSYQVPGFMMEIRSMNGDVVLVVHAVVKLTDKQIKEIEEFLTELVAAFCNSIGLVYFKDIRARRTVSHRVLVVRDGKMYYRSDPFLTLNAG